MPSSDSSSGENTPQSGNTVLELSARPINITRRTTIQQTPLGIPLIRDIIIIETEASLSRVMFYILLICIYSSVIHCLVVFFRKLRPELTNKIIRLIVIIVPISVAIALKMYLFVFIWLSIFLSMVYIIKNINKSTFNNRLDDIADREQELDYNQRSNTNLFSRFKSYLRSKLRSATHNNSKSSITYDTIYKLYSSLFYYSHLIVLFCIFSFIFSLSFELFGLLNFTLILFIYTNYFLILVQDLVGLVENKKKEKLISIDERNCAICNQICIKGKNSNGNILDLEKNTGNETSKQRSGLFSRLFKSKPTSNANLIALPCNHKFHLCCIRGWYLLNQSTTCPSCNEKFNTELILDSVLKGLFFYAVFMDVVRMAIVYGVLGVILVYIMKRGEIKNMSI